MCLSTKSALCRDKLNHRLRVTSDWLYAALDPSGPCAHSQRLNAALPFDLLSVKYKESIPEKESFVWVALSYCV